jgi:putative ADP-ribosylglycohydrolase
MDRTETIKDKVCGCLYGQAIGDALGFGTEGMTKAEVERHYNCNLQRYDEFYRDKRRMGWPIGMWTDDTEMMLSILSCIMECPSACINTEALARHFLSFYDKWGFTCGILTSKVLSFAPPVYEVDPISVAKTVWELKGKNNAPNGGLMRTSIIGLWPYNTEKNASTVCKMTHYDPRCVASCVIISFLIHNIVYNNDISLSVGDLCQIADKYDRECKEWIVSAFTNNDISKLNLADYDTFAYTYRTLSAAIWAYFHARDFKTGLLAIVNEGGDADTNAAIGCAVLGAKFGYSSIPDYYVDNLYKKEEYLKRITPFIEKLINNPA